jgi:thioredoxin-like negative regulator of GroEL
MVASVQARSNDDEAYVTEAYLRAADVFIQYRRPDEAQRLLDQARWQDKNGEIVQKMQSRIDRLRPK